MMSLTSHASFDWHIFPYDQLSSQLGTRNYYISHLAHIQWNLFNQDTIGIP